MYIKLNDVYRTISDDGTTHDVTVVAIGTSIVIETAKGTPIALDRKWFERDDVVLVRSDDESLFYRVDDDVISASEGGY